MHGPLEMMHASLGGPVHPTLRSAIKLFLNLNTMDKMVLFKYNMEF